MAFEFVELSKQAVDSLNDDERTALENLAKNKNIIISKADKGNAVVIQDVEDYKSKVMAILNTGGKFKSLPKDPTITREGKLVRKLNELWKRRKLDTNILSTIKPCGARAGVMYGLPKVHKDGLPIRPIISAIKTYNYGLAKYLDSIFKPLLEDNTMMIKDTFDFVNRVSNLDLTKDKHLVSFDVESLFTNIPTKETIEILLNLAFKRDGNNNIPNLFHGMSKDELRELLYICTQQSHFQFNGCFYDQIDGVAMGSPLGPLFANAFMTDFERRHKQELEKRGLNTWQRYVDDIFATIEDVTNAEQILNFLNGAHPNIRFTIEHEKNSRLAFLDTTVYRGLTGFHTTLYRKPTFTGVYLHWTSLTSRKYKLGLIYCLLDRIWKICDEESERESEIIKLKEILLRNEYPERIIENEFKKFKINRAGEREVHEAPNNNVDQNLNEEENEERLITNTRYIVLPYVSRKAEDFSIRLKKLVTKTFPTVEFNVAFKSPNEIGKFFPFKDNIRNNKDHSNVVYRIRCTHKDCQVSYIGKTHRHLGTRIKEHQRCNQSAVYQHDCQPGHRMAYEDVEIIDRAENKIKLAAKEALHILKEKPTLNKQLNSQQSFDLKMLIIATHSAQC